MEQRDLELIQKFSPSDSVLAECYQQHIRLEHELEKLERKLALTTEENFRKAEIKKQKLIGRDKIESLLKVYRKKT